ncbi:endonuclease domain-containing protein [uncultured Amnibacterium sp.]|uniref:endonuclease domain-containing protein n=1 Tax=uncultured Amnibacterium sp. TaxID=1631851 RepID=UPI0035C970AC
MRTFWTTADLSRLGRSRRQLSAARSGGALVPVRKGHFASPRASTDVVRCARVGGVATATTAARALGLWTPPDSVPGAATARDAFGRLVKPPQRLQVAVAGTAARLRNPDDASLRLVPSAAVVVHWTDPASLVDAMPSRIASPVLLVQHAFLSLPPERALAILDSALHQRFLRVADLHVIAAGLPAHLRPVVFAADARAESGIETIVRYLLRLLGLRVEPQVGIAGLGSVDLLVEGRLIIECDGREWHDDERAFEEDRRRDMVGATRRYRTLRFSWYQVLFRWDEVGAAVLNALAAA